MTSPQYYSQNSWCLDPMTSLPMTSLWPDYLSTVLLAHWSLQRLTKHAISSSSVFSIFASVMSNSTAFSRFCLHVVPLPFSSALSLGGDTAAEVTWGLNVTQGSHCYDLAVVMSDLDYLGIFWLWEMYTTSKTNVLRHGRDVHSTWVWWSIRKDKTRRQGFWVQVTKSNLTASDDEWLP